MKRLHLTIQCMAIYESGIDVPDDMSIEDAIEYAKGHLKDIPLGVLEYVSGSDVLDEENCDFEEPKRSWTPNKRKWFLEVVQDFDGTYCANMTLGGTSVDGLPDHVDYNTLRDAIKQKTGVEILKRKDMKFQQSGRKKYAFVDATQERSDCRVTLDEIKNGWKPDFGTVYTSKETLQLTAVDHLLSRDSSFRYMLLDRMRSDCEYYLGNGNRNSKHLWAGDEQEQIACMKSLWNSFPAGEKPDWLPLEQISKYEKEMVQEKLPLSQQISSASTHAAESRSTSDVKTRVSER